MLPLTALANVLFLKCEKSSPFDSLVSSAAQEYLMNQWATQAVLKIQLEYQEPSHIHSHKAAKYLQVS